MSVICSMFLVKLALRKQIFLKTQPCKCFVHLARGNPSQDCSELRKQHLEYTMTLCDGNHLAQVIKFFGKCKNLCVTLQFLLCYILNLSAISEYKPGLVFGGAIQRRVSFDTSLGSLPRRRSYLSGKKRRPVTADFQIQKVHFGP